MGAGAKLAYVRVSTVEQNEARQVENLKKYEIDKWFTEKVSAKDMNRPELQKMLDYAREGDTIYIHDFSRISRNTADLLALMELFERKGINLVSTHENVDTGTPHGRLMVTLIAAINEFERTNMLERQREGIAIAKRRGLYKGRKKCDLPNIGDLYALWITREKTKAEIAREYGISRPTLDRMMREYEKEYITKEDG